MVLAKFIKKVILILSNEEMEEIQELIAAGKIELNPHAELDMIKQNLLFTKNEIKNFFKNGKFYYGYELYPSKAERFERKYCIAKRSVFTLNLILIWFKIIDNVIVVHIQPLNRSSKEGKIYYKNS